MKFRSRLKVFLFISGLMVTCYAIHFSLFEDHSLGNQRHLSSVISKTGGIVKKPFQKHSRQIEIGLQRTKDILNHEIIKNWSNWTEDRPPKHDVDRYRMIPWMADVRVGERVSIDKARHILVASTWRSGSSFLAKTIEYFPGAFYSFEPLIAMLSVMNQTDFMSTKEKKTLEHMDYLQSIFECTFKHADAYLKVTKKYDRNFRYQESCAGRALCESEHFLRSACELYPVRVVKTVRLRAKDTEKLLKDENLNLKVIYLFRDPRGSLNSRKQLNIKDEHPWCEKQKHCFNIDTVCEDFTSDVEAAKMLQQKYPERTLILRYEDLCLDAVGEIKSIFQFLDLPWTQQVETYILNNTEVSNKASVRVVSKKGLKKKKVLMLNNRNDFSTVRNSKANAFRWRRTIQFPFLQSIQEKCLAPMEKMGYHLIKTMAERDDPGFDVMS